MSQRQLLPDPWFPMYAYGQLLNTIGPGPAQSGALNSAANRGVAIPVVLPVSATFYSLSIYAGNGTGNYDIGLYNADYALIASTGSTAMTAAGIKSLTLPEMRFEAGTLLYMAVVLSSTSGFILRGALAATNRLDNVGSSTMASALPLPDPWVPAVPAESTLPAFVFGVR